MPAEVVTSSSNTTSSFKKMNEPNATLYVSNIDWKIKKPILRRALHTLFSRHGKVRINVLFHNIFLLMVWSLKNCVLNNIIHDASFSPPKTIDSRNNYITQTRTPWSSMGHFCLSLHCHSCITSRTKLYVLW